MSGISTSANDVLAGRPSEPEEVKLDPESLNDPKKGEFRIESIKMKDHEAGTVLWESKEWDLTDNEEKKVTFPKGMLSCKAIGREIVFYSKKVMQ